jgi:UDP-glucose 4-epimerase
MKVTVTGSAGFIGQHVAAALARAGHEMVPFDRPMDVRVPGTLEAACKDSAGIIHLAGALGTAELIGSEPEAASVNILGALAAYDAGARLGIPVVQIGTGHKGQPNPYAITKGCAEDLGLARAQWTGARITVVRAYHVYGPGQKATAPHGPSHVKKIGPTFICRALTGMPLEVNGSGEQVIDLVYAADVADVLVAALAGPYGMVTEAGTGKPVTVIQAARDVIAATGSASEIRFVPMRDGEPEDAVVVAEMPECRNPWPHKLDETVAWYRNMLAVTSAAHVHGGA